MNRIDFVTTQHPSSLRRAIFEDDGETAWLYLTAPRSHRPERDCWPYNRHPARPTEELASYRDGPPPVSAEFAGAGAYRTMQETPHIRFSWSRDGESVACVLDGEVVGFIAAGYLRAAGFSRHLSKAGPWGQSWDEALYRRVFHGS